MIQYVIFDLDGTILDSERLCYKFMKEAFKKHDLSFPIDIYKNIIGKKHEESASIVESYYNEIDYYQIMREADALQAEYIKAGNIIPIKQGFYELAEYLKVNNIKMSLATSTIREKMLLKMKHIEILDYFDYIVCGDEVSEGKPNPEIYIKIIDHYHAKREDMLVIEDSINGITSAHSAGLKVIMIPDMIEANKEIMNKVVFIKNNLSEVIEVLKFV